MAQRIESRDDLINLYRAYGDSIVLERGDELGDGGTILVLEYEVHGRVVGSGAAYDNRFVSIVTLENRKIVHWRDYMELARGHAVGQAKSLSLKRPTRQGAAGRGALPPPLAQKLKRRLPSLGRVQVRDRSIRSPLAQATCIRPGLDVRALINIMSKHSMST
jgi:hypothetical protein